MNEVEQFKSSLNITIFNFKSKYKELWGFFGTSMTNHYPNIPIEILDELGYKLVKVLFEKQDINKIAPISSTKKKVVYKDITPNKYSPPKYPPSTNKYSPPKYKDLRIKDGDLISLKKVGRYIKAFDEKDNDVTKFISSEVRRNAFDRGEYLKVHMYVTPPDNFVHSLIFRPHPVPTQKNAAIDLTEQIKKLSELRDEGILTEEEFQTKKKELLDRI